MHPKNWACMLDNAEQSGIGKRRISDIMKKVEADMQADGYRRLIYE